MLRLLVTALAIFALGFAVACDDDDDDGIDVPGVNGTPAVDETPTNGETPTDGDGEEVTIDWLAADNIQFIREDTGEVVDEITVPAGASVTIEFTNLEALPHNFAVYESEDAEEEIFVGEIFGGPDETRIYEFTAPDEPGTYFFHCDVHPVEMTGDFVVE